MSIPKAVSGADRLGPVVQRNKPWTVLSAGQRRPSREHIPLTRRYEVSWIDDDGQFESFARIAPAMPIFEDAFSAFAHGAVISTTEGPVPVEDVEPGMGIETASGSVAKLRWVGAITLVPGAPTSTDEPPRLYRITPDSFGLGRPATDVTLGPAARLLNRDPAIRNALGCEAALAPVATFSDGMGVIEITPASPVKVYHLAFDGHHVIRVGGLDVESYHPGADAHYSMSRELREVFLSLFPHVATMQGFGRVLWPRFEEQDDGNLQIV
mgnify:CR=1 FL=1